MAHEELDAGVEDLPDAERPQLTVSRPRDGSGRSGRRVGAELGRAVERGDRRAPARRRRRGRTDAGARRGRRRRSPPARTRTDRRRAISITSVPPGRRSSIRGRASATGRRGRASRRRRPPRAPSASTMSSPQSNAPSTPPAQRSVPAKRTSTPSPPVTWRPLTRSGSPGEQAHRAHAVAADVHQPAAVERRPAGARRRRGPCRRCRTRTPRGSAAALPTARSRTSSRSRCACGWWRHMNASASTRPARSAASNAACASSGRRVSGFSHSTCLPASSARIDHGTCSEFGQRDVDRVDVRVGEQRLVAAVRAAEPVLGRVRLGPRPRRGSPPRRPRPPRRRGRRRGACG